MLLTVLQLKLHELGAGHSMRCVHLLRPTSRPRPAQRGVTFLLYAAPPPQQRRVQLERCTCFSFFAGFYKDLSLYNADGLTFIQVRAHFE